MFTGIIQSKGRIDTVRANDDDIRLSFSLGDINVSGVKLGDSIAVNGVCLTAVECHQDTNTVVADVSKETLDVTLISQLKPNDEVNLELALCAGDHLGGHIVSGHVDGVAILTEQFDEGESTRLVFEVNSPLQSQQLGQFIATKGSVTIDGVSLTVNSVEDYQDDTQSTSATKFGINIVPHTREQTIIGHYDIGQKVHIEIDMVARYMQRQLAFASQFKSS